MTDSPGHEYEIIDGLDLDQEEDLSLEGLQRKLTETQKFNITVQMSLQDAQDQLKLKDSQIQTLLIEIERIRNGHWVVVEDLRPKVEQLQQENDSLITALASRDQELFEIKKFLDAKEDLRLELEFCSKERRDSDSNRKMSLEDQKLHELKWFYEDKIKRMSEVHEEELQRLKLKYGHSENDPSFQLIGGNPMQIQADIPLRNHSSVPSQASNHSSDRDDDSRQHSDPDSQRSNEGREDRRMPESWDSLLRQLAEGMAENDGLRREIESLKAENASLMGYVKSIINKQEGDEPTVRRPYNHNQRTGTKILNLFKEFLQ